MKKTMIILISLMSLMSLDAFARIERIEVSASRSSTGLGPCDKAQTKVSDELHYKLKVGCQKIGGIFKRGAMEGLNCRKEAALQCTCSATAWGDCEV